MYRVAKTLLKKKINKKINAHPKNVSAQDTLTTHTHTQHKICKAGAKNIMHDCYPEHSENVWMISSCSPQLVYSDSGRCRVQCPCRAIPPSNSFLAMEDTVSF